MAFSEEMLANVRAEARNAPASGIVEVHKRGLARPGTIKLWVGEGNLPTPDNIRAAAARSLADGETFYTHQAGLPELRQALATYHDRVYGGLAGAPFSPDRFLITGSGMHAITLAVACVAGSGDEVIVPSPAWPNSSAAAGVNGAAIRQVPMRFDAAGWDIDMAALTAAIGPRTRAIFINSPSNPLGWVASRQRLQSLLDLARRHGLWIVADEVYGRFCFLDGQPVASSFHELMAADDKVIFVNTFSKNWAMTGWRIGWIEVPPALNETVQNLIQYSSSGTATFMQRGAIEALEHGEAFIEFQVNRARHNRDLALARLRDTGRVRLAVPDGAFYMFFAIEGETNTRDLCLRLVDEAGVGIAPGTAFGEGGDEFMRLCFAGDPDILADGLDRLVNWLGRNRR
ncbi:pyridoxal phosphate-dependent aminotransferase [Oryzibacter oryziterrae]|uniref:pyridoxal phosphate-dependent aminotransferase n=1 Tax=Oryzibacter oryziterrae TaxID=2766474 RepID=UPI001F21D217|nr:pyridoxal phosphate-dependent aminotransferase [Oryzibacter oryziterrae]